MLFREREASSPGMVSFLFSWFSFSSSFSCLCCGVEIKQNYIYICICICLKWLLILERKEKVDILAKKLKKFLKVILKHSSCHQLQLVNGLSDCFGTLPMSKSFLLTLGLTSFQKSNCKQIKSVCQHSMQSTCYF